MNSQRAQLAVVHRIALHRNAAPVRVAARFARALLRARGNFSYDPERNGERRALEVLGRFGPACVFDVGANVGQWTRMAHAAAPAAAIHCFEIVPETARLLERDVGRLSSVKVNALGLSDRPGTLQICYFPGASELSSIAPLPSELPTEMRECPVTTGDRYCEEHGVAHIDLLKVDVEGAERAVLDGFERMFAERRIDAVQFEYGLGSIHSHFLLRDFYDFFEAAGFAVGKIYPDAVEFRDYDIGVDEDFLGPNYMAVRRGRRDLIDALGGAR